MISAKLQWRGDEALAFFWQACVQTLNVSNPRPYDTPSKPGEPPRKRTGWLQRNVLYELDEKTLSGRVGITRNARYGLYLELGTRRMAARPWLLATLQKVEKQLNAIAGG
jgi:hypothetical protein